MTIARRLRSVGRRRAKPRRPERDEPLSADSATRGTLSQSQRLVGVSAQRTELPRRLRLTVDPMDVVRRPPRLLVGVIRLNGGGRAVAELELSAHALCHTVHRPACSAVSPSSSANAGRRSGPRRGDAYRGRGSRPTTGRSRACPRRGGSVSRPAAVIFHARLEPVAASTMRRRARAGRHAERRGRRVAWRSRSPEASPGRGPRNRGVTDRPGRLALGACPDQGGDPGDLLGSKACRLLGEPSARARRRARTPRGCLRRRVARTGSTARSRRAPTARVRGRRRARGSVPTRLRVRLSPSSRRCTRRAGWRAATRARARRRC